MAELHLNHNEVVGCTSTIPSPAPEPSPAALGLNDLTAWFRETDVESAGSDDVPPRCTDSEPPRRAPVPTRGLVGLGRLMQRRPYVVASGAAVGSTVLFLFVVGATQLLTFRLERDSMAIDTRGDQHSMSSEPASSSDRAGAHARR